MNERTTLEQMCDPAFRRAQHLESKSGAVFVAFMELQGLINNSALARQYFKRSPSWLSQRINGNLVFNKESGFRPEEYDQLATAFRDIARRLEQHASEIEAAPADPE